ncbi:MAG: hypothetical protein WCA83_06595 [Azonexus sp.]
MKLVVLVASALVFVTPVALGHGGEDHGAASPIVVRSISPRATTNSDEFEAVAVLENKKLLLYLDDFASNAPVIGAKVEIEGGGLKGVAPESSPGVYAVDAAAITPEKHPLTISIETEDSADLMLATLDLTPPTAGVAHAHDRSEWVAWSGAGLLALAGAALWMARRPKKSKGAH